MKRLENEGSPSKSKIGKFFKRTFYFLLFFFMLNVLLLYFLKDSAYSKMIRNLIGINPTVSKDTPENEETISDTILNPASKSDFFKFKTKYDTLINQENLEDSIGQEPVKEEEIIGLKQDSVTLSEVPLIKEEKINPSPKTLSEEIEISDSKNQSFDLFDELLLSSENNSNLKKDLNSKQDLLSRKSMLKIISICSKNILLNTNAYDNEEILLTLGDSDSIFGILISDRNGKVIFSTDKKYTNRSIEKIYPEFKIENQEIECLISKNMSVCRIPIFHTYGKIGNAIITSKLLE